MRKLKTQMPALSNKYQKRWACCRKKRWACPTPVESLKSQVNEIVINNKCTSYLSSCMRSNLQKTEYNIILQIQIKMNNLKNKHGRSSSATNELTFSKVPKFLCSFYASRTSSSKPESSQVT